MPRRFFAVIIACAWVMGCAQSSAPTNLIPADQPSQRTAAAPDDNVNELPEPPVLKSVNGAVSVSLTADLNPATGLPGLDYQGQHNVIPTLSLNPGEKIVIDLTDNLQRTSGMRDEVNLHFHGLGVSPKPPSDDVLDTYAKPGQTLHYVVHVPKNQEPGLYWYHPHIHGIVNYQVGEAGMSGAIIIAGLEQHLPALSKMRQRLIILRDTGIGANIVPRDESPNATSDMDGMDDPAGNKVARPQFLNNNPCGPELGLTVSLNNATQPVITMARGEKQFFRLVNASGHKTLKLAIDGEPLQVVAIDGFAYDTYPGNPPTLTEPYAIVPPAARVEFVVSAPKSGYAKFRSLCYDSGSVGDRDPDIILAQIEPPAQQKDTVAPPSRPLTVGAPLPVNVYTTALPPVAAKRTVVFSEGPKHFRINGQVFSIKSPPMYTVHTGTVEEWTVENNTGEVHDFHIHQLHFLVKELDGVKLAHPYWADSIVLPHRRSNGQNGSAVLLMDFRDPIIKGTFVFHCHILDHEDHGMMAKIEAI